MAFKFEKLRVWQKALELSALVHNVSREFPKEELFILTSQIKRAADSVNLNIAEGSTGQSNKEFIKFLRYSLRSNIEVVSCIFIAKEREIISEENFNKIYEMSEEILAMITALIKKLDNEQQQ
ncbi:four helix bundle protein [Epilithonimonas sp.]|uniref:four helix bundle protein n=1 Tax=Epilithonimonas sp. TaxID=2894511 RepID=UPI00289AADEF|nr:four helix bundle protein [Epilithonimonas sp.]